MFILKNRKHKLPIGLISICIIGLLGFKDTGIFVKDHISLKEDGTQGSFSKYENIKVVRELDSSYIVSKDSIAYEVPMDSIIVTKKTTQKYKVTEATNLTDIDGHILRVLNKDEIVQVLSLDKYFGKFSTTDNLTGFIELSNLEVVEENNLTYGISKIDKVIKNQAGKYYTLLNGEYVSIKGFVDGKYIVIDSAGNEFSISEQYITLRRVKDTVSRGATSRKADSITKVVELAYSAIGRPYVYGGTGAKGYDCSGLTSSIYLNATGIKLNRTSRDQTKNGIEVSRDKLIPGDLVFFKTSGSGISHVGIYIGDGNMIHASSGSKKVIISSLNETYYKARYVTAVRVINN